ncbi:MAG: hypothetical protein IAF38_01845 [Bacteroidia bacterium]|nr:hypothetical protein [Bacteroidia bacterium]
MKFIKFLVFLLPFAMLVSCKKDKPVAEKPDLGYDYYPDQLGRYVIYDCDSTVYQQIYDSTKIYKFQIKEVIDSLFTDNQGRPALRISRYKKLISIYSGFTLPNTSIILNTDTVLFTDSFKIQDVWWANKTTTTAEVVEENNRYTKLIFPVEENKTWNGNANNTLGPWDYEYINMDEPLTLGTLSFDKTCHVNQFNSQGIVIYKKIYDEKYARGVGMIYKEITDYTWKVNGSQIALIGQIDYGLHYKMTAIQYGTE